jgi:pimeloyl-ACP methyl ester carboxylesterase
MVKACVGPGRPWLIARAVSASPGSTYLASEPATVVLMALAALTVAGLAFSPQLLDRPDFEQLLEPMLPAFPQNEDQMAVTVEQWDADLAHDTLDRLGGIQAPTLVVAGEQDLLTPPWQAKAVADAIPGARYELVTGPGSSHCLHIERPDDLVKIATGFIDENRMQT